MKKSIFIILMIFTAVSIFSTASQAGAIFLMIYPGARAMAMGGAYTALCDDALAPYYNPAGLGLQVKKDLILQHVNWLPGLQEGMYYEYFGGVFPTEYGVFGAQIIYLTTGETQATTENDPTGTWTTFDFAIGLSYAYKIKDNLSVGANTKFIYSFLAPDWVIREYFGNTTGGQGQSVAFDFGVMYNITKAFNLGASLSNLGPGISYLNDSDIKDPLPTALRIGIAYKAIENELNDLTFAMDINKVFAGLKSDSIDMSFSFNNLFARADSADALSDFEKEVLDTWISIGVEYVYYNLLAIRGGYFLDYLGRRMGFTFGGGVIINNSLRIDLGVDSNIYDFDTNNYRISIGFRF